MVKFLCLLLISFLFDLGSRHVAATHLRRSKSHEDLNGEAIYLEIANARAIEESSLQRKSKDKRATNVVERPGNSVETHECGSVTTVPSHLRRPEHMYKNGLDNFYQKYTHAYGIPIVGSPKVTDSAIRRACYLVRFMFADRPDIRESFYKMFGRLALMAPDEMTTDIPEHSHLEPVYWDARARGLGATRSNPVSTGGEENALCLREDRYPHEDIVLHETSHGFHLIGAQYAIPGFNDRLVQIFESAKSKGLWANTYAMTDSGEYWAEVVQSYFNDNDKAIPSNGIHNDINTREKLRNYDPDVFQLIREVFPCDNTYLHRCQSSRELEAEQQLLMNCNGTDNNFFSSDDACQDTHFNCSDWALGGECEINPAYMLGSCRRSCRQCTTAYRGQARTGRKTSVSPIKTCQDTSNQCRSSRCVRDRVDSVEHCRKTCVSCNYYQTGCYDDNGHCISWAAEGECQKNPAYMLNYCKKSCHQC